MIDLSADRPSSDPKDDLFGHAPFATQLATSIGKCPSPDGMVLALYGPWGSGKSTVLNYIRHYLEQSKEQDPPIIVAFNPWWFSGQENLARAFIGQLQAVLPTKSEKFRQLGNLFGEFAEGIGGLIDLTGFTGGVASKIGKAVGWFARPKPKDVPGLKAQISKILQEADKRILVLIDDIDRLAPEETRQLFTVIKALGDFPNVIYLLAFDREVATSAIQKQMGLAGQRYLDKIVQVPFEMPPIDQTTLHAALFKRLDLILDGTLEEMFDQAHWINAFNNGIEALIKVPRDVVRFSNTLSVTYPTVRGEVNPVDFIALESIRVFLPELYDVIRGHEKMFIAPKHDDKITQAFHDKWAGQLPEELRRTTQSLVTRLFPKTAGPMYGNEWLPTWRKELRICHPDLFKIYFRLHIPAGAIRRGEIVELISLGEKPAELREKLIEATRIKRPDGISKARALLERMMDHVETDIPDQHVSAFIKVLLDMGDDLIIPSDEQAFMDFGNESRVTRVVYHLLKRIDQPGRLQTLTEAISEGRGIGIQNHLIVALLKYLKKGATDEALFDPNGLEQLKRLWIGKLESFRGEPWLVEHKRLPSILAAWAEWKNLDEARIWCQAVIASDGGLVKFISTFRILSRSQSFGDAAVKIEASLNPKWLERYIDVPAAAVRLVALESEGLLSEEERKVVSHFLKEYEMNKRQEDPNTTDDFD